MDDPFDDLFTLEDRFYDEGFRQGESDGQRAGLVEGRTLGLENGFKKFSEAGRLQGRAIVWANRLHPNPNEVAESTGSSSDADASLSSIPALPPNARLQKNLRTFYALVEPGTLSTVNTDESVNDFDDRVKRAQGRARVIEKMVGELAAAHTTSRTTGASSPAAAR